MFELQLALYVYLYAAMCIGAAGVAAGDGPETVGDWAMLLAWPFLPFFIWLNSRNE
jgi:hypothetical protein